MGATETLVRLPRCAKLSSELKSSLSARVDQVQDEYQSITPYDLSPVIGWQATRLQVRRLSASVWLSI